ncbi:MAG: retropepsin-like aspartic protease [Candidatus Methanoperedens sp.]
MEIEFSYRKENSKLIGVIYRPIAKVEFKSSMGWVPELMYVDSGADITLIPKSLGDLLGFDIQTEEIHDVRGVGETAIPVILKNIEIKLGEYVFNSRVAWALIEEVPPLLGRLDVFDQFDVNFTQKEKKVVFRR